MVTRVAGARDRKLPELFQAGNSKTQGVKYYMSDVSGPGEPKGDSAEESRRRKPKRGAFPTPQAEIDAAPTYEPETEKEPMTTASGPSVNDCQDDDDPRQVSSESD